MSGLTLTVAIVASVLALTLRPAYVLAVYIIGLLWYPNYLVVSLGTVDISVGRVAVVVLLLRCLFDGQIRGKFTWIRLDTWVTLSMVVYVGVFCATRPLLNAVENRGGFLMDTWFAYMVARFIVSDRETLMSVIKCVGVALVPLAVLGVIESVTGWQPFIPLQRFCPWVTVGRVLEQRWGLTRATGPFNHSILFGSAFAIFLPLVYYLRHNKNHWRLLAYILSAAALVGALSSMSAGPWVMTVVVIICLVMENRKKWVKPLLIFSAISCIGIGVISNRPFYHVMFSYAGLLGGAGWHRARLIDAAIQHFDEWWLIGYGTKDPGWGGYLGMAATDVTNEFILAGVRYGILGIIVLSGVLTTAFRGVLRMYRRTRDPELKSLCWALGTILVSVIVTWMSVSFFGQIMSLFYCALGIIGSSSSLVPCAVGYINQPFQIQNVEHVMI